MPFDIEKILTGYVNWCLTTTFDEHTMNILITRWRQNNAWNNVFKYRIIEKFLMDYFLFTWQLIISRNLGGGIWDNTDIDITLFLRYLDEILGPRSPITLPDISENIITRENENQLVAFLTDFNAQSTYPMLLEYSEKLLLKQYPAWGSDYESLLIYKKKMKDYSTTHLVRGGKRKSKKRKSRKRKSRKRKSRKRKSRQRR